MGAIKPKSEALTPAQAHVKLVGDLWEKLWTAPSSKTWATGVCLCRAILAMQLPHPRRERALELLHMFVAEGEWSPHTSSEDQWPLQLVFEAVLPLDRELAEEFARRHFLQIASASETLSR